MNQVEIKRGRLSRRSLEFFDVKLKKYDRTLFDGRNMNIVLMGKKY